MNQKQDITAIIYDRKGRVLSVGKNSYEKTHPLQARFAAKVGTPKKIYLHAEIDAIVRCKDLRKAHRIEVIRVAKNGDLVNAKPCSICQSAIESSGIKIVSHT